MKCAAYASPVRRQDRGGMAAVCGWHADRCPNCLQRYPGTFEGVQYPGRGSTLTFSIRNIKGLVIGLVLMEAALKMQHALQLFTTHVLMHIPKTL